VHRRRPGVGADDGNRWHRLVGLSGIQDDLGTVLNDRPAEVNHVVATAVVALPPCKPHAASDLACESF